MLKHTTYIKIFSIVCISVFLLFIFELINNDNVLNDEILSNQTQTKIIKTEKIKSIEEVALDKLSEREIKKPFGIFITKQNSPIQPERFSGYHTGLDLEILGEEKNRDVEVYAICEGEVVDKKYVSGYGGVLVQKCILDEQEVRVLYGHLNIDTIKYSIGNNIQKAQKIGLLGAENSIETDFERKHLHISIYKGGSVQLRGYVQAESELINWIDPCKIIACNKK